MRSGFRNAEPGAPPGGAESERSALVVETCGAISAADVAPAAFRSTRESAARVVAAASSSCVSQMCPGTGDISRAAAAETLTSAVP